MTDADNADGLALVVNTQPDQNFFYIAKRNQQEGLASTVTFSPSGKPLPKLVDQFTYISSNISYTESNVNIRLVKVWNAIDKLSIIWKYKQSDKIKWEVFQS